MNRKKPSITIAGRLQPGDTVGIAAPAGHFQRRAFERGVDVIASLGYRVHIPKGVYRRSGYLAGSDRHRADVINALFADPAIKAVWCARGGYGSMRVLPHLDYRTIRQHPKIVIGFSDATALLATLYTRCGLATFHGPMVATLGDCTHRSVAALTRALASDEAVCLRAAGRSTVVNPGRCEGPVIGGNLTTLCHLLKTPFEPLFGGHILFLEDTGEAPYRLDRMLGQMKMAGCFADLAGLALGSFKGCGTPRAVHRIVAEIFSDQSIPILRGIESGHGRTNLTVPLGVTATLDTAKRLLAFHEPATREPAKGSIAGQARGR